MIKKLIVPALAVPIMAMSGQTAEWNVDVAHSSIGFSVSHLVVSEVTGKFEKFSGTVNFDGKNVETGSVQMEIDAASVNTAAEKRDGHLKSPDFFDVEKYPTITFVSKKVIKGEGNKFQIVGDMTMHGVTKEVTFDCVFRGTTEFMGAAVAGFKAHATINRQDFGVSWSKALDSGGLVAGDDVDLNLDIELHQST